MNILDAPPDKLFKGDHVCTVYNAVVRRLNPEIVYKIRAIDCGRTTCNRCHIAYEETNRCPNCGSSISKVLGDTYGTGGVKCSKCSAVMELCSNVCTSIAVPVIESTQEDTI